MAGTRYSYYEDVRSSYYERLIYPAGFASFNEITDLHNHPASLLKSSIPVKFKTLEFGDNQRAVIRKLGKPRFMLEDNGFSENVLFYKEELLNHKLLVQLHFFNDTFVLATQSIIDTDSKWRAVVKAAIQEKYSGIEKNQEDEPGSDEKLVFEDPEGNRIFLMESINLNLVYSSGNNLHTTMVKEFHKLKLKKINEEERSLKALLKDSF